jgi:hypothetical protein
MASIEQIIKSEANPFDPATFKPGNFWQYQQDLALNVNSIHQEVLADIEALLNRVAKDHHTRTVILCGESGSGKSHLLSRIKRTLNSKAFFSYIDPWNDNDFIWRHILRQSVDSLIKVPDGQQESQLLLWLKSLSVFKKRSFINWIQSDRQVFIRSLREAYPSDIYNANEFFGVLYDLLNPELRHLAYDWLRGDSLREDDLKALQVRNAIANEDAAKNILANFGRISAETQPIVLCFDNLDSIPPLPDGSLDLQPLFSVNSTIRNEHLKNFLVILSFVTNTWNRNKNRIQPADLAKIDVKLSLKPITIDQAEAIWKFKLAPLHQQASTKLASLIYPLSRQALEETFPGGKTLPRNTLILGCELFQKYKQEIGKIYPIPPDDILLAHFKLLWLEESNKLEEKITRIRQFSATDLIGMLQKALSALPVTAIQPKLLPSKTYSAFSLSYQPSGKPGRIGVVWTEESNMTTFCYVMKDCSEVVQKNLCETLYLIRAESVGRHGTKGNKTYTDVFTNSKHRRIEPDLSSVCYLATYQSLARAASAGDLVVGNKIISLQELEDLICKSEILHECTLLQKLGIFPVKPIVGEKELIKKVKELLLNIVEINQFLGRQTLIVNAKKQFAQVTDSQVEELIQQLCQENKIQILDDKASPAAQLICFVPQAVGVKK